MNWLIYIIGFVIGGMIGFIACALFTINKQNGGRYE